MDSLEEISDYERRAREELAAAASSAALEEWYRAYLAPSGRVSQLKKQIGKVEPADRKRYGTRINELAQELGAAFEARRREVDTLELERRLKSETVDVTLPSRPRSVGGYHPVTLMMREVCTIFERLGFSIFDAPNVELDEYNFQLLNIPQHHPARDMQDTFYVSSEVLLRTHTSPGQIRAMRAYAPAPIRVILPGLCYRNEDVTPRSEMQFNQVEGLVVGPNIRMSDLKGILLQFARMAFGEGQAVRFRGSYFPFTEPSVEVDVRCALCNGKGCRVCKHTGWLELLGAGLVHPTVLKNGGYDPARVRGIAFGMGIERMVLILHGIEDIRYFYQNDLRLTGQFV